MDFGSQKAALQQRLATLSEYPKGRFAGAGLVVCAGGAAMFTNAYVLVHVLRNALRCRLPIEVWHFGPEELSARMRTLFHQLDAGTVDALEVLNTYPANVANGWQLKVYAAINSRFERVLLIDADNVPTGDPSDVFAWEAGQTSGAILWPDVVDIISENPVWEVCGLKPRVCTSVETGQLFINKPRCWRALQIALHMNENASFFYDLIYGDKDTWLLALLMTQTPYAVIPHRPSSDGGFCLFQHDMDGRILFQHRTRAKWTYSGVNRDVPGFVGGQACDAALAQLRSNWNGHVFNAPERSAAAMHLEATLEQSSLTFAMAGEAPSRLDFQTSGELRSTRAECLNWHFQESDEGLRLLISDQFGPVWSFACADGRRWRGESLVSAGDVAFLGPAIAPAETNSRKPVHAQWPMPGRYSGREDAT